MGEKYRGHSKEGGVYGDVIEEFDDAIGQLLAELDLLKLTDNTIVLFSVTMVLVELRQPRRISRCLREGKGTCLKVGYECLLSRDGRIVFRRAAFKLNRDGPSIFFQTIAK